MRLPSRTTLTILGALAGLYVGLILTVMVSFVACGGGCARQPLPWTDEFQSWDTPSLSPTDGRAVEHYDQVIPAKHSLLIPARLRFMGVERSTFA